MEKNVWNEKISLKNAKIVYDWLLFINGMGKEIHIEDGSIPNEEDWKNLIEFPENYEYEFRLD